MGGELSIGYLVMTTYQNLVKNITTTRNKENHFE